MEVTPTIWRRLLVPGEVKLSRLHTIFQAAMGWEDYHLHFFEIDSVRYGTPDPEGENDDIDEESVTLSDLVSGRTRFFYEYDFGDSWRHEVVVESMDPVPAILKFAVCVDGQRACPPEDCGGTGGYQDLVEAIGDSDHEEEAAYVEWAGVFDPELFDLAITNAALQRVR
jgi:Plasmid pRiA4b ORF-3-like protein